MKRNRPVVITKRDGTLECFSIGKLRACLARVMRGSARDVAVADPLARAVGLHLREQRGDSPPSTEYVYRCVCLALTQTGLGEVTAELAAHRRLRQARRRRVRIFDSMQSPRTTVKWRKGAVVAALQNVYDLRQSVARFLAGQIEEQVFALGYRLVSKTFMAELVRNEVLAWGLLSVPVRASHGVSPPDGHAVGRQPREEE